MNRPRFIEVIIAVAAVLLTVTIVLAGTPKKISYQGKATDADGNPVPDGYYPAEFYLYDHPTAGTVRWSESSTSVYTSNGLFTYLLGNVNPIPDTLFARYDSLYLQVVFNHQTISLRRPLVSSGYALRVNAVDGALGGTIKAVADTGVLIVNSGPVTRVSTLSRNESNTSDTASAIRGVALNTGSGTPQAGHFLSINSGDGRARGIMSQAANNSWSWAASSIIGHASNAGSGPAYGGVFYADSGGTGDHTGIQGKSVTAGEGVSYGGDFNSVADFAAFGASALAQTTSPSGQAYGLYASAVSAVAGSQTLYGVQGRANAVEGYTGVSYGGYFENLVQSGSNSVGLQGYAHGMTTSMSSIGVYGRSGHDGPGNSYGGYFYTDSTGTGGSYGARTIGLSMGGSTAYGITGIAANRANGAVYGGYFEALNYGSGGKYGVYGKAPSSGYAGYFNGDVYVTGDFAVGGTKSAAVKTGPDEYRLVYSQESPEYWFEDFGEGQLVGGRTHIELDPTFLQTVTIDQLHQMKVFIQLNDSNCNGTAVIRDTTGFDVVELMNGTGNAAFTYRVVAKRRGYEDVRLARVAGPSPEEMTSQLEADHAAQQEVDKSLEQNTLKTKQDLETQAKQIKQKQGMHRE